MTDVLSPYFKAHLGLLIAAWLGGMAILAYFLLTPGRDHSPAVAMLVVMPLLCSPFTFRTRAGQLWWLSYGLAVSLAVAAVLLGGQQPAAWPLAGAAACCYAAGVCLRWRPLP